MGLYLADLHNHSRYSNDMNGFFPYSPDPEQIVNAANKKNISIFALSEKKNPLKVYRRIKKLGEKLGMCIISAGEVRTREGVDLLAIDINEEIENSGKYSCFEVAEIIKEQGGKVIVAHSYYPVESEKILELYKSGKVDASECVTGSLDFFTNRLVHNKTVLSAKKYGVPQVGFSDAFNEKQVGTCCTLLDIESDGNTELDKDAVLKSLTNPQEIVRRPNLTGYMEKALHIYKHDKINFLRKSFNLIRNL